MAVNQPRVQGWLPTSYSYPTLVVLQFYWLSKHVRG